MNYCFSEELKERFFGSGAAGGSSHSGAVDERVLLVGSFAPRRLHDSSAVKC